MSTTKRPPDGVDLGRIPEAETGLGRTQIYDVLSNERRAMVLDLLEADEPRELSTLAELIAAEETGEHPPPRKKRTSVYVTLHQTHLPKLEDLGIVEYDDREKVVWLGDRASIVLDERDDGSTDADGSTPRGWSGRYLAVVATGLGLAGASAAGLPALEWVSAGAYALTTLVVLLAVLAYRVGREGGGSIRQLLSSLLE